MTPAQVGKIGQHAVEALMAARDGDPFKAAVHAIEAALEAVPADEARSILDASAVARAEALGKALDDAKFGAGT